MNDKIKILIVEDDINLGFMLMEYLENEGFDVKLYRDGETGYKACISGKFDFFILDLMLPKMDGFTIVKEVRKKEIQTPIIMLTARSLSTDKIKGFNLGIDDYVTKPFNEEELACRINAILQRQNKNENSLKIIQIGSYTFNQSNQNLSGYGSTKRLTKKEAEILKMLGVSKNKIVKRSEILIEIWGDNDYFSGRSLDVFVSKLRKYLQKDKTISIESIPSVGLILNTKPIEQKQ